MSRPHRLWVPEGVYHLTLRGNDRQPIFLDPADYQQYLNELHQARLRYPFRLLAYALMPNHAHLVVEALPENSVSDAMRQAGGSYSRYFNHRYHRVGHVYQGRFYSNLVDRDEYLLEVTRYVHLNPFRARLVRRPVDYPWSSYHVYLGLEGDSRGLVEPERILSLFAASPEKQVEQYRDFVDGLAADEMEAWVRRLRRTRLIPSQRWLRQVEAK